MQHLVDKYTCCPSNGRTHSVNLRPLMRCTCCLSPIKSLCLPLLRRGIPPATHPALFRSMEESTTIFKARVHIPVLPVRLCRACIYRCVPAWHRLPAVLPDLHHLLPAPDLPQPASQGGHCVQLLTSGAHGNVGVVSAGGDSLFCNTVNNFHCTV